MSEENYDVVIKTLEEAREKLWKMTRQNIEHNNFNIMDQIRLEHIDHLESAINCWKKHKRDYVADSDNE